MATSDHFLFIKKDGNDFLALLVYVDDIVVVSNNLQQVPDIKCYLNDLFKIKDLGELKYFLGLEIASLDLNLVSTYFRRSICWIC